jgi:hypothetical protein
MAAPSDAAKKSLFARIESTPRTAPALAAAPSLPTTLTLPSSKAFMQPIPEGWVPKTSAPPKSSRSRFRPSWGLIATPLATVPLVLALGIVGLWAMNTHAQLNDRTAQVQTLNEQVSFLNSQVTTLNSSIASVDKFIPADDAKRYDIDSTDSDAAGQVIANPGTDQAMLLVQGLENRSSTYEVLLESSAGTMVSAGDLPVNDEGKGMTVLSIDQPFSSYRAVHIRLKENDGSFSASDTELVTTPDTLFAEIDSNLGQSDDTGAPSVGISASR